MLHKTFDLLETKTDSETGTFEATVAVFGNVDLGGDRILPGAFKNTLAKWSESGDPIPVILSHQWDNPMAHIGVVDEAKETNAGLWVKGTLDVTDNDVAKQVHKLMKRRSLKEFSFGYDVPKGGQKRAKDGANDLLEINLAEVGPTLKGMNPATELHAVKSALEAEELPDPDVQRKEAERVARETVEERESKPTKSSNELRQATREIDRETQQAREQAVVADVADLDLQLYEEKADEAPPKPTPTKSVEDLRQETNAVARERQQGRERKVIGDDEAAAKASIEHAKQALVAQERFEPDEIAGIETGLLKAVWTTAYINDLPDSAFLYIESGGSKDSDGKTTPRSLRHFPYKDSGGAVDVPHLRNALSRIPQSSLPQDVKDRLTARAQRILDNQKSADETGKEPKKARSVDPLRKQADTIALEFASDGQSLRRPPRTVEQPKPEPELALSDLKRRMRDEILIHLSGDIT